MKHLATLFLLALIGPDAVAQLQANAGADTVWCRPSMSANVAPQLGGGTTAVGGVPPYTHAWSVDYPGQYASILLDSPLRARPLLKQAPPQGIDSLNFILEVTDAVNSKAYDTVKVLFSRWMYTLAQCIRFKGPSDTVSLFSSAASNFQPLSFQWTPAAFLSNAFVESPRTWTPVTQSYTSYTTDRAGCQGGAEPCSVVVSPARIADAPPSAEQIRFIPNPLTPDSRVEISSALLGTELRIFSVDGRLIRALPLQAITTPLQTVLPPTAGTYFYRIQKQGETVQRGKLTLR